MMIIGRPLAALFVGALVVLFANPSLAACSWQFDCSSGTCRQVPVCSSSIDIVPVKPARIAPIPAPTIRPIQQPTVPPVGTTSCQPRYLCNSSGNCSWRTLCQ